jgi:hypothetical protein
MPVSVIVALGAVLVVCLIGFGFAIMLTPRTPRKVEPARTEAQLELTLSALDRIQEDIQQTRDAIRLTR